MQRADYIQIEQSSSAIVLHWNTDPGEEYSLSAPSWLAGICEEDQATGMPVQLKGSGIPRNWNPVPALEQAAVNEGESR